MDNAVKRKAVNNFVEYWNDTLYVRGKPPANRQLKRYLKAKLGSKTWEVISTSTTDVQFFTHYTGTPIESRRKWLDTTCFSVIAVLHNLVLRLVYLSLWHMSEGINLTEIKDWWEQCVGHELSEVMVEEMTKQLGADGAIRFGMDTLGLSPGSVAGANARLKGILRQRLMKQGEYKSEYEQDLSVGLWECSEGAHLDEFGKILSNKGDLTEIATSLRRLLKDSKAIRGIVLEILRKTIEDLPDVHQDVRKLETQGRELPLTEEVLATVPSKHDDLVEPSPADLLEHIGISRDDTSEAEWQVFMMLSQKVLDGELEVGSKTGLSISAVLGKDASRVRKTISRYRERQLSR